MTRLISLLAVLVLAVAACGGDTAEPTTTTEAPPETTEAPPEATTAPETTEAEASGGAVDMVLVEGTEARFYVDEVLLGNDVRVEAVNKGVTGGAVIDFENPDASTIGPITIDAAGFVTDESRRNGAIEDRILDAGSFPEITFEPTSFVGAADVLDGGTGTITGDLTITGITHEVTFEVSGAEVPEDGLTAFATAVVDRTLWDISIPKVPMVASVSEEVTLEIDLVLTPAG